MKSCGLFERLSKDCAYSVAIRKKDSIKGLLYEGNYSRFYVMPINARFWYADPIVFSEAGADYLFCEVFDRKRECGYIGVTVLDSETPDLPHKILDIGTHLSYPFVFKKNGEIYMIPETTTKLTMELYKAINFPNEWEYVCCLMQGKEWADTTIYQNEKATLLLAFEQFEGSGSITNLKVYDASNIEDGNIIPYAQKVYDFSNRRRGAGRIFSNRGKEFRPAQNCTREYGYALDFMAITSTNECYSENRSTTVYPDDINTDLNKKIIGIHTYGITEKYEIIDVKFNDPKLRYQIRRAWRYFKRRVFRRCLNICTQSKHLLQSGIQN